jgi:sugar phosphate isomerase/epimerase
MKHRMIHLTLVFAGMLVCARAAEPEFFAMDTGTRDSTHITPEEQVALVQEVGFAGIAPIYRTPQMLRETLVALDRRKLRMFAVYVPLDLDSHTPVSPAIRDTIEQLRGRNSILWLHVTFRAHKPSDPAGDAKAVPVMREVADLAKEAGVRVSLYPHIKNWLERVEDGVRLARQVDRENFGVTFNFCHWLMVDGGELDASLRQALPHLMMVTINGADADAKAGELGRFIQPLGAGSFDVGKVLAKLAELKWQGPIGLQHYGIKGEAKVNLQRSMDAWREMSRKVWPPSEAHERPPAK